MSEAGTPTKSAFAKSVNSGNLLEAVQENRSSSNVDEETIIPVIVPASEVEDLQPVNLLAFSNWVEPIEKNLAALMPSVGLELVALIQELRSSNSNLLKQVTQLEQVLAECQNDLQSHKQRSHFAESMLTQQTQELAVAQEQVKCLCPELEASHQTAQRQQILIETLTAQLQSSQERVACLERECSLIQASYNEQYHHLMQTEDTCRELRTRLNRQQRHSLQLKVALEKCLEVSVPISQSEADTDTISTSAKRGQTTPSIQFQSFFAKPQPIRPWSVQPESFTNELEPTWDSHLTLTPPTTWVESAEELSTLAQVESAREELSTPAQLEEIYLSPKDTYEGEEAEWQNLLNVPHASSLNGGNPRTRLAPEEAPAAALSKLNLEDTYEGEEANDSGSERALSDQINEFQLTESPELETSSFNPNINWPSPVIYPSRPPKGRKSLAAIELPTFSQTKVRSEE